MIETTVQTVFSFACDRCGINQTVAHRLLPDARDAATAEGFVIDDWLQEGCPRQTCFCRECDQFILDKAREDGFLHDDPKPGGVLFIPDEASGLPDMPR